jgi:hypothetical protein
MPVVRKTVAIHPLIDSCIRKVWAKFIEAGCDATYSTILNLMLLGCIYEVLQRGWSEETIKLLSSFLKDEEVLKELNLQDHLANAASKLLELITSRKSS